jgi:hypothetical protein
MERKLAAGQPADVTIFSATHEWNYNVNDSPSKSRNSPFDGRSFKGAPMATIVAGKPTDRRQYTGRRSRMNLDGKVAIITGSGGKGTGRAVARRFAQEGMAVVVSDTNHTGGDETVALIAADRGRAAFHPADVKNEHEINGLIGFRGVHLWRPRHSCQQRVQARYSRGF